MSSYLSATTNGNRDIEYLIENLENFEKDKVIRGGLSAAGRIFVQGGKRRLAARIKHKGKGTGNLMRSMTVRVKKRKPGVLAGFSAQGPHAHLIDRGTKNRYHKSGKFTGRVIGNRFWQDTKEQDGNKAIDSLYLAIGRAVDRINNRR